MAIDIKNRGLDFGDDIGETEISFDTSRSPSGQQQPSEQQPIGDNQEEGQEQGEEQGNEQGQDKGEEQSDKQGEGEDEGEQESDQQGDQEGENEGEGEEESEDENHDNDNQRDDSEEETKWYTILSTTFLLNEIYGGNMKAYDQGEYEYLYFNAGNEGIFTVLKNFYTVEKIYNKQEKQLEFRLNETEFLKNYVDKRDGEEDLRVFTEIDEKVLEYLVLNLRNNGKYYQRHGFEFFLYDNYLNYIDKHLGKPFYTAKETPAFTYILKSASATDQNDNTLLFFVFGNTSSKVYACCSLEVNREIGVVFITDKSYIEDGDNKETFRLILYRYLYSTFSKVEGFNVMEIEDSKNDIVLNNFVLYMGMLGNKVSKY
jgi:hypothetical protein